MVGRRSTQDVSLPTICRHVCDGRGEADEQRVGIPFRAAGERRAVLLAVVLTHTWQMPYYNIVVHTTYYDQKYRECVCIWQSMIRYPTTGRRVARPPRGQAYGRISRALIR